MTLNSSEMGFL